METGKYGDTGVGRFGYSDKYGDGEMKASW